ncbi:MAG: LytTR family DNA-binding domain-containing protein [Bryobacteraceae bacterium]|nr:LytTR family DNA-binding domain-containing protein [Bryobacteraceae bacterium]
MRVLIADDEAPARARLRQLLALHPAVEVVGEAATGVETLELTARLRPDLVLLDIEMPATNGIDVAAALPSPRPHVVFCTAHDQYAVDAFELAATDYLLKPISRARLAKALERARTAPVNPTPHPERFLVKHGHTLVVVEERQVLYFAAVDGLTRLVTVQGDFWMDPSLNDLEARLRARRFFRVSREALLHLAAVAQVQPLAGGTGRVVLKNGHRLDVSRRRFRDLLAALGA